MQKPQIRVILLVLFASCVYSKTLDCLDNNGKSVPWFFDYKLPGNVSNDTAKHAYLDSKSSSEFQILSGYVDAAGQALYNTIKLINEFSSISLIAFNDEPPSEPWVADGAHAKGFIAFDNVSQTGVYVMHSAPKFPNVSIEGKVNTTLPSNTRIYAQNFYCTTFDSEEGLTQIIEHLKIIYPIYYYRSGVFAQHSFRGSTIKSLVSQYHFGDGEQAWFLSKSPNYTSGFLYENVVEPHFKLGFEVESWGRPYQNPVCNSTYESLNVDVVKFNTQIAWDHYSDHSKWALSLSSSQQFQYACSCDMNRMDTQALRGGSCLCTKNQILYKALKSVVSHVDLCANSTIFETQSEVNTQSLTEEIEETIENENVTMESEDFSDIFSDSDI